jgi:hypothetical protein
MYTSSLSLWPSAELEVGYLLPAQPLKIFKVGNTFYFIMTGEKFLKLYFMLTFFKFC